MALVLLAVAGLTLTASTQAIASLADDAMLVAHAQAVATSRAEQILAQPCDSAAANTVTSPPRVIATVNDRRSATFRSRLVDASLAPPPLSLRGAQHLALGTARSCP